MVKKLEQITNFSQLSDFVNEIQDNVLNEESSILKEFFEPDSLITLLFELNTLEPENKNYFKLHQFVIGNPKSKDLVKKSIKYLNAFDLSQYDLLNLPYETAIEVIKTELRTYINFEKNKKLIYQSFFEKNVVYFEFLEFLYLTTIISNLQENYPMKEKFNEFVLHILGNKNTLSIEEQKRLFETYEVENAKFLEQNDDGKEVSMKMEEWAEKSFGHLRNASSEILNSYLDLMLLEFKIKSNQTFEEVFNLTGLTSAKDRTAMINNELSNFIKKFRGRLNIGAGGKRERKGFTWTNENKIQFWKEVNQLPKLNGQSVWKYIFNELVDVDFDIETQDWLQANPIIRKIPSELFDEAISKLRNYYYLKDISIDEHKPRYFDFCWALSNLEFPNDYKYSTLKTYFAKGKSLAKRETQKMI